MVAVTAGATTDAGGAAAWEILASASSCSYSAIAICCLFLEIFCHSSGGMPGGRVDPFRTRTLPRPGKVSNPKPLVSVPSAIPFTDTTASCDTCGSAGGCSEGWYGPSELLPAGRGGVWHAVGVLPHWAAASSVRGRLERLMPKALLGESLDEASVNTPTCVGCTTLLMSGALYRLNESG